MLSVAAPFDLARYGGCWPDYRARSPAIPPLVPVPQHRYYPHYVHRTDKLGHPFYYERPADINIKALKAAGVTDDALLRHYLFITEYLWNVSPPKHTHTHTPLPPQPPTPLPPTPEPPWPMVPTEVFARAGAPTSPTHPRPRCACLALPRWWPRETTTRAASASSTWPASRCP